MKKHIFKGRKPERIERKRKTTNDIINTFEMLEAIRKMKEGVVVEF
jgi:hypothetical protein